MLRDTKMSYTWDLRHVLTSSMTVASIMPSVAASPMAIMTTGS